MTGRNESRWTLASTGNRVLLAVVVGVLASACASFGGVHGAARVVVFAVAAAVTYALVTVLRGQAGSDSSR